MKNTLFSNDLKDFYAAITKLKDINQISVLFSYLLSESELIEINKRFKIFQEIKNGADVQRLASKMPDDCYIIAQLISAINSKAF